MNENIITAFIRLFAAFTSKPPDQKPGEKEWVSDFLFYHLNEKKAREYITLYNQYHENEAWNIDHFSVKDSVKMMDECKTISKTISQNQKFIAYIRLLEFVKFNRRLCEEFEPVLNAVALIFSISGNDLSAIREFVSVDDPTLMTQPCILLIDSKKRTGEKTKHLHIEEMDHHLSVLKIPSTNLYFIQYKGVEEIILNNRLFNKQYIHPFPPGSKIKLMKGSPLYYSDIQAQFTEKKETKKITIHAENICYISPKGKTLLENIHFSEIESKLVGILSMDDSRRDMIRTLGGMVCPSSGNVRINGIDVFRDSNKLSSLLSYVSGDTAFYNNLTVYENVYYFVSLQSSVKDSKEQKKLTEDILSTLGLTDVKDIYAGTSENSLLTKVQYRKLSIAMALAGKPSVLFLEEPLSGLSFQDGESIMDILKGLASEGLLIFVSLQELSTEIYKIFDSVLLLDTGGIMIYYGKPVEAIDYFNHFEISLFTNDRIPPHRPTHSYKQMFNTIRTPLVNEFGEQGEERKYSPTDWHDLFIRKDTAKTSPDPAPMIIKHPMRRYWLKQFYTAFRIDLLSGIRKPSCLFFIILTGPLLGLVLSCLFRYNADSLNGYTFRQNENIPAYIFSGVILFLVLGLIVGLREIYKHRKIPEVKISGNLLRSAYYLSKFLILFLAAAIQSLLFVLVGNHIIGIHGFHIVFWLALLTGYGFAVISAFAFSSVVRSYTAWIVLLPILIFLQLLFGGAMISYNRLSNYVTCIDKTPVIGDFMVSKWIYEAMIVRQFKYNEFEKHFYLVEKKESVADYKQIYYLPALMKKVDECIFLYRNKNMTKRFEANLELLRNELQKEKEITKIGFAHYSKLDSRYFNNLAGFHTRDHIKRMDHYYRIISEVAAKEKKDILNRLTSYDMTKYWKLQNDHYNEAIASLVKDMDDKDKLVLIKNRFIQKIYPIYRDTENGCRFCFRSHLFAPEKRFSGRLFDTFWFNLSVVWFSILLIYTILSFDGFKKAVGFFQSKRLKDVR